MIEPRERARGPFPRHHAGQTRCLKEYTMAARIDMAKFAKFCKDNGFIFQSSEIYGGINGFWDYGPLGVELKKNIKDAWWQDMVRNPPPGPRRPRDPHGGAGLQHHHESGGVGGERTCRSVLGPVSKVSRLRQIHTRGPSMADSGGMHMDEFLDSGVHTRHRTD